VHKTTSLKPKDNQPIPQLAKPKPKEVEWTDDNLSTTKSAQDAEDQVMALWLYDAEDNESRENGEEDEVNQVTVSVKNAVEDLEPPHTSSDQSRGAKGGEGVSWVNPRKHPVPATKANSEGRHKVYPNMEDDTKSILTIFNAKDDAKSVPAFLMMVNSYQCGWTLM
jgi:hypothetical protein